jgi:putative transposase
LPRLARVVLPGLPYHITHRGNRRQDVFFRQQDCRTYKRWLGEYAERYGLEVWSYCLMTNHVHLLVVARRSDSLAMAIGRTHGRFAQWQNKRNDWSGHLWANRFYSTPLDEEHLWTAVKYVELNPVRADMVDRAEHYEWSSARSHARNQPDRLLAPSRPFPGMVENWSDWLAIEPLKEQVEALRKNTSTGRPTGSDEFVARLEARLARTLRAQKRGRKPGKKVPVPSLAKHDSRTLGK